MCLLLSFFSVDIAQAISEQQAHISDGLKSLKLCKYIEAERAFEQALDCAERDNANAEVRLQCLSNLGLSYVGQKNFSMAESTFKQAVVLAEKQYGNTNPQVSKHLESLAAVYALERKGAQSQAFFRRALPIRDKIAGNDLSDTLTMDIDSYRGDVRRKVQRVWVPPRGTTASAAIVGFKIFSDGHIDAPCLVKSSGRALVDSAAIIGVFNASPFRLLPVGSPESIDIELRLDPQTDFVPAAEPPEIGRFKNF